jgi:D-alanyl-D-alanine carboxypeptidase
MHGAQRLSGRRIATLAVLVVALSGIGACASPPSTPGPSSESPVIAATPATTPALLATSPARPVAPGPTLGPAIGTARLPTCVYADDGTRYTRPAQWKKTLLDTNLMLTDAYEPPGLVALSRAGIEGNGLIRRIVVPDLEAMTADAKAAGNAIDVRSAHRSYQYQVGTFERWVDQVGEEEALSVSARPGHSEHQLGTTLDFGSAGNARAPWAFDDWAKTPAGKWLRENAWRYGFVMSYPKGARDESCYTYEPWHYRFLGRELAREVHESGLVPRRYLWEQFETAP